LIKYIKNVLWRAAKRLSYIEDARCLKVNNIIDCLTYAHYTECSVVPHLTLSGDGQYLHENRLRSFSTPATPIKLAETVTLLTSITETRDPDLGQNIDYPN